MNSRKLREIERSKLLPPGADDETVGASSGLVQIVRDLEIVILALRVRAGLRIVANHGGAESRELARKRQRRRETNIIRRRLEGQPQQRTLCLPGSTGLSPSRRRFTASSFSRPTSRRRGKSYPRWAARLLERLEILREAVAAVAQPRIQERPADPRVARPSRPRRPPHRLRHARTAGPARWRRRSSGRGTRCRRASQVRVSMSVSIRRPRPRARAHRDVRITSNPRGEARRSGTGRDARASSTAIPSLRNSGDSTRPRSHRMRSGRSNTKHFATKSLPRSRPEPWTSYRRRRPARQLSRDACRAAAPPLRGSPLPRHEEASRRR